MSPGRSVDRTSECPICAEAPEHFGRALVCGDVPADFFRCPDCWTVFAGEPTWIESAYTSDSIADRDIGLVARNLQLAGEVEAVLLACFPQAQTFLDYGAGNGLFVRLMRDKGFPFEYFDPYGPNLFARGFEVDEGGGLADIVTALEVVEHLLDPVGELEQYVSGAHGVVLSTTLVPKDAPPLHEWWYYSLSTGQHITVLSARSLRVVGERLGFHVRTAGSLHILSRSRAPRWRLSLLRRALHAAGKVGQRRTSLLDHDYEHLFGETLECPRSAPPD